MSLPTPGAGGVVPNLPVIPSSTLIPPYMNEWYTVHSPSGFRLWGTTPLNAFPRADAKSADGLQAPTLQVFTVGFAAGASAANSKTYRPPAADLPHIIEMQARDAVSFYGFAMFQGNDGFSYPAVGFKVGSVWSIYLGGRYGDDGPGRRKLLSCVICGCYEGPTDGADPYSPCSGYACPYSNCWSVCFCLLVVVVCCERRFFCVVKGGLRVVLLVPSLQINNTLTQNTHSQKTHKKQTPKNQAARFKGVQHPPRGAAPQNSGAPRARDDDVVDAAAGNNDDDAAATAGDNDDNDNPSTTRLRRASLDADSAA